MSILYNSLALLPNSCRSYRRKPPGLSGMALRSSPKTVSNLLWQEFYDFYKVCHQKNDKCKKNQSDPLKENGFIFQENTFWTSKIRLPGLLKEKVLEIFMVEILRLPRISLKILLMEIQLIFQENTTSCSVRRSLFLPREKLRDPLKGGLGVFL